LHVFSLNIRSKILTKFVRTVFSTTERQADRQTGRQADRQTGRQADRQTGRQTEKMSFYLHLTDYLSPNKLLFPSPNLTSKQIVEGTCPFPDLKRHDIIRLLQSHLHRTSFVDLGVERKASMAVMPKNLYTAVRC
jgi:hypothetical protein